MRVRVRVPEAYLLLRACETSRPGLLVLDGDGRRVASIPLPGMGAPAIDAATIAKRLKAARTATAVERWRFSAGGAKENIAKLHEQLASSKGVSVVAQKGGAMTLRVVAGASTPGKVAEAARRMALTVRWHEPVPVAFVCKAELKPAAFAAAFSGVAGAWHLDPAAGRAFITPLLLDSEGFPAGWTADVEAREFVLPGIPQGGAACRVALAPARIPGVVALFADVFNERQTVVGRKGKVDWAAVKQAFVAAGCKAKEQTRSK